MRELIKSFGLINVIFEVIFGGGVVKRELGVMYIPVCYGCPCAQFELYVLI